MGKSNSVKFDVYELDMWADGEGGWTENSRVKVGQVSVSVRDDEEITPKAVLLAMNTVQEPFNLPFITTADMRKVYAEDYYGTGQWWKVGAVKGHRPLYGLQLIEGAA